MLGAFLTYARENGIIETNPAHGIRKPAYQNRTPRLSEDEYRLLGKLLRNAARDDQLATAAAIASTIALTGCRREAPELASVNCSMMTTYEEGLVEAGAP